jgi:glycerol-3-phosphate dehydrogenase (NAD(P)+)
MNITVLGAGVMGTAFTLPVSDNGHAVKLVGTHLDGDLIEEMHETRVHPGLRSRIGDGVTPLPIAGLDAALPDAELIVLGVNSHGVRWAAETLGTAAGSRALPPVLMLTKGLAADGKNLTVLPEAFRKALPRRLRNTPVMAIGGPCIAGELAVRRHSCVNIAGTDARVLKQFAATLRTPYYHVWTNTDLIGLEVCVALKNVYAMAVGLSLGLLERDGDTPNDAKMHNPAAALFAQGIFETQYVVKHMGGRLRSVLTLPGAGDLYVTSQGGRNSRMGRLLGLGMPYAEARAKHMPTDSVEGAMLCEQIGSTVRAMAKRGAFDARRIPLILHMIGIVLDGTPADIPWDAFFATA